MKAVRVQRRRVPVRLQLRLCRMWCGVPGHDF